LIIECSFNKSEATNYEELRSSREYQKLFRTLGPEDVVALISKGQNQMVFLHGYDHLSNGHEWEVLFSQRIRIKSGKGLCKTFEPKMLGNYAHQVGIELIGIKLFEAYYKQLGQ
jgi:hypothetical protein